MKEEKPEDLSPPQARGVTAACGKWEDEGGGERRWAGRTLDRPDDRKPGRASRGFFLLRPENEPSLCIFTLPEEGQHTQEETRCCTVTIPRICICAIFFSMLLMHPSYLRSCNALKGREGRYDCPHLIAEKTTHRATGMPEGTELAP